MRWCVASWESNPVKKSSPVWMLLCEKDDECVHGVGHTELRVRVRTGYPDHLDYEGQ